MSSGVNARGRARTLALLALLFAGLAAFALLRSPGTQSVESTADATDGADTEAENLLFGDWSAEDVYAVRVEIPESRGVLTLSRVEGEGDFWTSSEFGINIDQQLARGVVRTAASIPYLQVIEPESTANYEQYGLSQSTALMLISVVLNNQEEHAVVVGSLTADDTGHYALVDDREEIYVIDRRPIAFYAASLRDLYAD